MMPYHTWKKIIKKSKKKYYRIGHVAFPAFGGEKIHFNKYGWSHLIRKGKNSRDIDEQRKRIELEDELMAIGYEQ